MNTTPSMIGDIVAALDQAEDAIKRARQAIAATIKGDLRYLSHYDSLGRAVYSTLGTDVASDRPAGGRDQVVEEAPGA